METADTLTDRFYDAAPRGLLRSPAAPIITAATTEQK